MVDFILSPIWFHGIDAIFETVTMFVAMLISIYSYNIYRFSKNKRYFWFGTAFSMLSLSFLVKIFLNIFAYYNIIERNSFGLADKAVKIVAGSEIFFLYGLVSYRVLMLLAFLGIYLVMSSKVKTSRSAIILLTYFVLSLTYFSKRVAFSLHLTASLILFFIFAFSIKNCYCNKNKKSLCVASAFFVIMVSQLLFILAQYNYLAYVIAEVTQLIGYSAMLSVYIMIKKDSKVLKCDVQE